MNNIKRAAAIIALFITLGAMVYGFVSGNYTLAILIILVVRLFIHLIRVNIEH